MFIGYFSKRKKEKKRKFPCNVSSWQRDREFSNFDRVLFFEISRAKNRAHRGTKEIDRTRNEFSKDPAPIPVSAEQSKPWTKTNLPVQLEIFD